MEFIDLTLMTSISRKYTKKCKLHKYQDLNLGLLDLSRPSKYFESLPDYNNSEFIYSNKESSDDSNIELDFSKMNDIKSKRDLSLDCNKILEKNSTIESRIYPYYKKLLDSDDSFDACVPSRKILFDKKSTPSTI
ncbi:hypothetical protein BGC07_16990 [Piscirickettsia litoralis]|uniref:Uncharacterized protein n=2 Tax=Piscirickettsia litoralis TaxID=1891921 RepID=A0ABX2ZXB6_9GAMM|nr:hypothetical protein BGC07_16990 [Piscirickettsia litoralis]